MTIEPGLIGLLMLHEGFSLEPYRDPSGVLTIGYGHNLEASGISREMAGQILIEDAVCAVHACRRLFPDYERFPRARRMALADMAFNLGESGLAKFLAMRVAIERGAWNEAAREARNSKWFRQVGTRGERIVRMIETGQIDSETERLIAAHTQEFGQGNQARIALFNTDTPEPPGSVVEEMEEETMSKWNSRKFAALIMTLLTNLLVWTRIDPGLAEAFATGAVNLVSLAYIIVQGWVDTKESGHAGKN